MTGGDVLLKDANADHLGAVIDVLQRAGDHRRRQPNEGMRIYRNGRALQPVESTRSPSPASRPTARRSSWR